MRKLNIFHIHSGGKSVEERDHNTKSHKWNDSDTSLAYLGIY